MIQDITQRKQSEQALRASEEKYRSLIDHIPDVVWTADSNRNLVYISGNAVKVLGYSPKNCLIKAGSFGWTAFILKTPRASSQAYQKLFSDGEKFDVEYHIRRKDGQWIWLHDRALTTQPREGIMCADGIFRTSPSAAWPKPPSSTQRKRPNPRISPRASSSPT